ncbi:MAG: hypothetical protein K2M99_01460, partial [Treponemataceae bacterium]|nr:hypothetical protein [Treponemataceae bacterium]
ARGASAAALKALAANLEITPVFKARNLVGPAGGGSVFCHVFSFLLILFYYILKLPVCQFVFMGLFYCPL